MIGFSARKAPRLIYGADVIDSIVDCVNEIGGDRVFLVTDPGIEKFGHAQRVEQMLLNAGKKVFIFDDVIENPTTEVAEHCANAAREFGAELFVGIGGGSSLDTAKGGNFLLTNGGEIKDYWGFGKAAKPMLPFIAIPTTAGTGSECQSYALVSDPDTHQKMACGDLKAMACIAILDPKLTTTQPRRVAACTAIDAMAHALEAIVTLKRNELSSTYARESFRLLQANIEAVFNPDCDLEARGAVLLGASFAGLAIENSMLGAAHSAANPLTAHYDVNHGRAVGLMLPHVMRFNMGDRDALAIYAELAINNGLASSDLEPKVAADRLIARVDELLYKADLELSLCQCGVDQKSIEMLAGEAMSQWTAQFNPRPVTQEDFVRLYHEAYDSGVTSGCEKPLIEPSVPDFI